MEILQEFALDNIHCAPEEDRQLRFRLVRATRPKEPAITVVSLFGDNVVRLPDNENPFHVYLVGRVPSTFMNLQGIAECCNTCRRHNDWINMEDDMNERNFIFQMYNDEGVSIPRKYIYYKISKEGFLILAVRFNNQMRFLFDIESIKYMRTYSNPYYRNETSNDKINVKTFYIQARPDLVTMNRYVEKLDPRGTVFYYINGYFTDKVRNDVGNGTVVEVFHDTGIRKLDIFKINNLRTFLSRIDKRNKYFIHRTERADHIQYHDDLEIYIVGQDKLGDKRGLYYYQNREEALRNVTDKDFSMDVMFTNYHAELLAKKFTTGLQSNEVFIYFRDPAWRRELVYSSLKLHELYKLPRDKQLNVMLGQGDHIEDFRVEYLEDSMYWKIAGEQNIFDIIKEDALEAVGYDASVYYYGYTPTKIELPPGAVDGTYPIPYLYSRGNIAYYYNKDGLMEDMYFTENTNAPIVSPDHKFIEFIQGKSKVEQIINLFSTKVTVDTKKAYRVYTTTIDRFGSQYSLLEPWRDVTGNKELYTVSSEGVITFKGNEYVDNVYQVVYPDEIFISNANVGIDKFKIFNAHIKYILGEESENRLMELNPATVEIFINGHRLMNGLDFFMDFPHILICNKEYLNVNKLTDKVDISIRMTRLCENGLINVNEIKGFVNHGVISRNSYYDINDDKVSSIWIDGKLQDIDEVKFAEDDSTKRTMDHLNGQPYVIADKEIDISILSGLPSHEAYEIAREKNIRIGNLFTKVLPEKDVDPFNVIRKRHKLYSPLVTQILEDLRNGKIPKSVYTREYQSLEIRDFLDSNYPLYMKLDPMVQDIPHKLVEINALPSREVEVVDIFQYRFLYNVIKVVCGDNENVNLSGVLMVNNETNDVDKDVVLKPPGFGSGLIPFD